MKRLLLVMLAALAFNAKAQTFVAHFTFDSVKSTSGKVDPTPLPALTGATLDSFRYQGPALNSGAAFRFSFNSWPTGAVASINNYDTLSGSIDTSRFYQFSIDPQPYYQMTLDSITFTVRRSGTGIRTYAVRSSVDTFSTNLTAAISNGNSDLSVQPGNIFYWNADANTNGEVGSTISLGTAAYSNDTTKKSFRFYAWNSESNFGTFSIDSVKLYGKLVYSAPTTAAFSTAAVCHGDTSVFTNQSSTTTSGIVSYLWDFGDMTGSTAQNPTHLYSSPGNYNVTLSVMDASLNTYSTTQSVMVNSIPTASFTSPTQVCGDSVTFMNNSSVTNDTITSYAWDFGDASSGANNISTLASPTHVFSSAGTFNIIQLITTANGCSDSASSSIIVNIQPSSSWSSTFISDSTYDFSDMSSAASGNTISGYSWNFGDSASSSNTSLLASPSHTFSGPGTYTVCQTVYDNNGCSDSTCQTITVNLTGLIGNSASAVKIYPNPASTSFRISGIANGQIKIMDISGKVVHNQSINERTLINIETISSGVYFLELTTASQTIREKLVIE